MKDNKVIKRIKDEYALLTAKKYSTIAGTLVYFFIMSIVPFCFWLTLLFGRAISSYETLLNLKIFSGFEKLVSYIAENAASATNDISVVLLATTLYSSTNLFYHIRRSGEIIYSHDGGSGLKVRLAALALMFLVIIAMAIIIAFFSAAYYFINKYFGAAAAETALYCFLPCAAFLFAMALNLYICPFRLKLREAFAGALITTALWVAAAVAFRAYLLFANAEKLYGAVSAAVVFLLWLYVMMSCFVIGVIFNSGRIDRKNKEIKKF